MIINFFKSKPTLKQLIPSAFVDIHSHVLPGIDDGAKNIEESLTLISEMKKMGFSKIIGTPHIYPGLYDNNNESIMGSFEKIKSELKIKISLDYSAEYMLDDSLIEKATQKKLLTIKKNHILLELGFVYPPNYVFEIMFELQTMGYQIILAHPERYFFLHKNYELVKKLKKLNCKFQINLLSSTGYYGKDVVKFTDKLLKEKLIDYTGSDIHNINHINHINNGAKVKLKNIKAFEEVLCANEELK